MLHPCCLASSPESGYMSNSKFSFATPSPLSPNAAAFLIDNLLNLTNTTSPTTPIRSEFPLDLSSTSSLQTPCELGTTTESAGIRSFCCQFCGKSYKSRSSKRYVKTISSVSQVSKKRDLSSHGLKQKAIIDPVGNT